jgi:hypothetical protein
VDLVNTAGRRRIQRGRVAAVRAARVPLAGALLALTLGACGTAAGSDSTATQPRTVRAAAAAAVTGAPAGNTRSACGTAAGEQTAQAAGVVARRIYALELASAEVRADQRQVESYEPLLAALAANNRAAANAAVTTLVYSHTHVVRLRVSSAGAVVSDVGGPYILAPVGGPLRFHGRTVGSYVLSVQDDSGYQKLEDRYIGAPVIMRIGSRVLPVEGTLGPSAASLPESGPVTYHGGSYQVFTLHARAFPTGTLSISLLIPAPRSSTLDCRAVAVAELDRIGQRVWGRFIGVGATPAQFVHALGSFTGALSYVRAGSTQIAGSTQPGPPLRDSGTVRYHGTTYSVFSFPASVGGRSVRVYELLPA